MEDPEDALQVLNAQVRKCFPMFNRQGQEISFFEWVDLLQADPRYPCVAGDVVKQGDVEIEILTSLIGQPLSGGMFSERVKDAKPLIFETMVFLPNDREFTHRYATEEEAKAGHAEVVSAIREGRPIALEDHGLDAKLTVVGRIIGVDLVGESE